MRSLSCLVYETSTRKKNAMTVTEQNSDEMKNLLRNIADWTLVMTAFGLVFASLYHMGVFDWLNA